MYFYNIVLRDKFGKLLKDKKGHPIKFDFTDDETNESFINLICQEESEKYLAICEEGTEVEIDVKFLNITASTYITLYSYYSVSNGFIKLE